MGEKKLNSTEIARLAGVSRSTVSRVINGYSNVPEKTREKVMRVIHENDYYPLLSGQLLVGKKTKTLGFIWVTPDGSIAKNIQCSAFFAHVTESAAALGYLVLACVVKNLTDAENVDWVKRIFMQERVDAGVFIGVDNDEPLIEELIARGKIVGIFDHYHPDRVEPNRLSVNFETDTGEKVIDYVHGLGHRQIAIIDGPFRRFSFTTRHIAFLRGLQKYGLPTRPEWCIPAAIGDDAGREAARRLLALPGDLPSVICANNDDTAFGVYEELARAGLRIPEDISVIGIDGHTKGTYVQPPLTTFAFDFGQIFRSLVSRVVAVVEGRDVPLTEFFSSTLAERSSCAHIKITNKLEGRF